MNIYFLGGVEDIEFNSKMLEAVMVVDHVFSKQKARVIITGTSGKEYPSKGYHNRKHAIDFRSSHIRNPGLIYAEIYTKLQFIDTRYRVLYHDTGSGWHFHVEYRFDNKPFPEGYPEIK